MFVEAPFFVSTHETKGKSRSEAEGIAIVVEEFRFLEQSEEATLVGIERSQSLSISIGLHTCGFSRASRKGQDRAIRKASHSMGSGVKSCFASGTEGAEVGSQLLHLCGEVLQPVEDERPVGAEGRWFGAMRRQEIHDEGDREAGALEVVEKAMPNFGKLAQVVGVACGEVG